LPDLHRAAAERATRDLNRRPGRTYVTSAVAAVHMPPPPTAKPASVKRVATKQIAVAVPASGRAAVVIRFALAQVGKPYVWAAAGPSAYDCWGLVMAAYARVGIRLPHQSGQIAVRGRRVPAGQWMPGDVIYFPGHVALYIGDGKMVEAANPRA